MAAPENQRRPGGEKRHSEYSARVLGKLYHPSFLLCHDNRKEGAPGNQGIGRVDDVLEAEGRGAQANRSPSERRRR